MAISVYVYSILSIINIVNTQQVESVDYRSQFPDIPCGNLTCYGPYTARCNLNDSDAPCHCVVGFMGHTCTEDENECTKGHPCINRGHCINTIGSFSCNCLRGWTGDHCQFGTEDPQECMPGWTLPRCTHDLDECANTSLYTCLENQNCRNTRGKYTCDCNAGWKGLGCQENLDECEVDTCKNNGTCIDTPGSFICQCQDGWQGHDCAADVDECMASKCKNNGSCMNTNGSFRCQCQLGWQDFNCENDVNECSVSPCNNNETCINTDGSFRCQFNESLQLFAHSKRVNFDFIETINIIDQGVSVLPVDELSYNETLMAGIRIAYITFKSRRVVPTDAVGKC